MKNPTLWALHRADLANTALNLKVHDRVRPLPKQRSKILLHLARCAHNIANLMRHHIFNSGAGRC